MLTKHALQRSAAALALFLCLSIAHAADGSPGALSDVSEVVVTGTRIRQTAGDSTTPVTVITGQQLESGLPATTERGGGNHARFQASGGQTFGKLSGVFALEVNKIDPIWSRDRDFMSSTTLHGAKPTTVWSRQNT